jgi:branched-chain amino acid transport system substrate-binding protein
VSGITATASQVAERYGVPYVNAESSSPGLTERGFKWIFRPSPHDGPFSVEFMKELEKRRGIVRPTVGTGPQWPCADCR